MAGAGLATVFSDETAGGYNSVIGGIEVRSLGGNRYRVAGFVESQIVSPIVGRGPSVILASDAFELRGERMVLAIPVALEGRSLSVTRLRMWIIPL